MIQIGMIRFLNRRLMENIDREEVSRRTYKSRGYYVATEKTKHGMGPKGDYYEIRSAYTLNGDYIGGPKTAYFLTVKRGIAPELISKDTNVCSVGYCEKEDKWYGWSHRAISGFPTREEAVKFARSVS